MSRYEKRVTASWVESSGRARAIGSGQATRTASMQQTVVHSIARVPPLGPTCRGAPRPAPSRAAHARRSGDGVQSAVDLRIAFCRIDAGSLTRRACHDRKV